MNIQLTHNSGTFRAESENRSVSIFFSLNVVNISRHTNTCYKREIMSVKQNSCKTDGTHSVDKEIRGYTKWNKHDRSVVVIDFSRPIRTFCFLLAPSMEPSAVIQCQVGK